MWFFSDIKCFFSSTIVSYFILIVSFKVSCKWLNFINSSISLGTKIDSKRKKENVYKCSILNCFLNTEKQTFLKQYEAISNGKAKK